MQEEPCKFEKDKKGDINDEIIRKSENIISGY